MELDGWMAREFPIRDAMVFSEGLLGYLYSFYASIESPIISSQNLNILQNTQKT